MASVLIVDDDSMVRSSMASIITGMGDPDGAELAIKSGAWDYIEKGASPLKAGSEDEEAKPPKTMQAYIDEMKRKYILDLMQYVNRDVRRACAVSGLFRSHPYQLLKKFDISA